MRHVSVMHGDWLMPRYLSKERKQRHRSRTHYNQRWSPHVCCVSAFIPVTIHSVSWAALSAHCHKVIARRNEVFSAIITKCFFRPVKQLGSVLWGTWQGAHSPGTLRDSWKGFWKRASLSTGTLLGEPGLKAPLLGALKVMKGRLWGWASLFMGAQLGKPEWAHLPGTLRYGWKGLWGWSVCVSLSLSLSLCGSSVKGTWREGSLAVVPEGYVEKALEMGISFHRGPVWGTWRRARLPGTLRDGWRGLWVWSVSLWKGAVEGALEGSYFTGDPGRYIKKVSG
jgi:hypothetical protein